MGKYMKKSKITGDVAVMELSQPTTLGVRTRARTLALQRLQQQSSPPPNNPPDASSVSYLQLRSRRLEKPAPKPPAKKASQQQQKQQGGKTQNSKGGPRLRVSPAGKAGSAVGDCEEAGRREREERCFGEKQELLGAAEEEDDLRGAAKASFGDNCSDYDARDRSTRESTPCNLIRNSETIGTPGSTTRQSNSRAANRRVRNDIQRMIPTTRDMEEFFTGAEQQQQRQFVDKYNFDIVNDLALPGRYEWIQLIP